MSSADRAAELRAQADALENLGGLEEAHADAVEAYRADPADENKAAYRDASDALAAARSASRAERAGVSVGGDAVAASDAQPETEG